MNTRRAFLLLTASFASMTATVAFAQAPPYPGQLSHSWTQQDVNENDPPLALPSGATVDKTNSAGSVKAKWCPGKETNPGMHGPHELVEVSGGANATIDGATSATTVNVTGSGSLATVNGNHSTVNISGNSGTTPNGAVAVIGNYNDVNLSSNCKNWSVGVIGDYNDIDLNNCDDSNSVVISGTGNTTHN